MVSTATLLAQWGLCERARLASMGNAYIIVCPPYCTSHLLLVITDYIQLRPFAGNECWPPEGETFDSGCLAFVRNSTLDSRLSLVNVSGCTLVGLQNGTPMEIVFFNTDVSTFMLNYTLLQRVGEALSAVDTCMDRDSGPATGLFCMGFNTKISFPERYLHFESDRVRVLA